MSDTPAVKTDTAKQYDIELASKMLMYATHSGTQTTDKILSDIHTALLFFFTEDVLNIAYENCFGEPFISPTLRFWPNGEIIHTKVFNTPDALLAELNKLSSSPLLDRDAITFVEVNKLQDPDTLQHYTIYNVMVDGKCYGRVDSLPLRK